MKRTHVMKTTYSAILSLLTFISVFPLFGCEKAASSGKSSEADVVNTSARSPSKERTADYMRLFTSHYAAAKSVEESFEKTKPELGKLQDGFRNWATQQVGIPPSFAEVAASLRRDVARFTELTTAIDYTHIDPSIVSAHKTLMEGARKGYLAHIKVLDAYTDVNSIFMARQPPPAWAERKLADITIPLGTVLNEAVDRIGQFHRNWKSAEEQSQANFKKYKDALETNAPENLNELIIAAKKETGYGQTGDKK